ncbi:hypothetical protein D3X26_06220 [Acinetobacter baumannii]|uniref:hypothetical protein n=1 Tax=Acinetobacter baumannii TaxID=470 RepID=UPI000E6774FD|nr:hypothetical protein [Acinetobacter baumannii]MDP7891647.1 hypothetical protein [Acinetobacter baumannii]QFH46312.1 hypothetical protein FR761_13885 [Acinetobacter baumannii]RIW41794.1 hypothetical protein D3X31_19160 [Acinetobacter baumannii]RIW53366.1 hypothetical protein D3X27_19975 [Acinetobacter baumannii]RIW66385.1 hypothetical protein D3X25_00355 [Acinetobacter baumannii]
MKATKLIRDKGLQYAKEIVDSAPSNATEWNEGYEFQCGQSVEISPADREKYFVDLVELKRLVESVDLVNSLGGIKAARSEAHKDCFVYNQPLLAAIAAYESIYGGGDE